MKEIITLNDRRTEIINRSEDIYTVEGLYSRFGNIKLIHMSWEYSSRSRALAAAIAMLDHYYDYEIPVIYKNLLAKVRLARFENRDIFVISQISELDQDRDVKTVHSVFSSLEDITTYLKELQAEYPIQSSAGHDSLVKVLVSEIELLEKTEVFLRTAVRRAVDNVLRSLISAQRFEYLREIVRADSLIENYMYDYDISDINIKRLVDLLKRVKGEIANDI